MKKSLPLIIFVLVFSHVIAEPEFTPRQVVPPFAAIKDAPLGSIANATQFVDDNELVLGVSINNQARAYPINMLTQPTREIINDSLGGKHIAATW